MTQNKNLNGGDAVLHIAVSLRVVVEEAEAGGRDPGRACAPRLRSAARQAPAERRGARMRGGARVQQHGPEPDEQPEARRRAAEAERVVTPVTAGTCRNTATGERASWCAKLTPLNSNCFA